MASKILLDLRGVTSPLDLLKCKSCLNTMQGGETMEVILTDMDVVNHLIMIVKRSNDQVVYQKQHAGGICLGIRKG